MPWTSVVFARIRHSSRGEVVLAGIILLLALAVAVFAVGVLLGLISWVELWHTLHQLLTPHNPIKPLPCEGACWRC